MPKVPSFNFAILAHRGRGGLEHPVQPLVTIELQRISEHRGREGGRKHLFWLFVTFRRSVLRGQPTALVQPD